MFQMVMRKTTFDSSVRYIPITGKIKKQIKPKTTKAGSLHRKQNRIISQNNKKIIKNFQHPDSNILNE